MKNLFVFLLALFLVSSATKAQYHRFSNPISAPLYFNPAFAGSVEDYRVALAYRKANGFQPGTQSLYGSYDQLSHRLHGAFGVEVFQDFRVDRLYDTRISAIYAGKINLGPNWMLSPALKVGYQRWEIPLVYYEDLDLPALTLNEPLLRHGLNFSPAIMVNTSNFYFGVAVDQLASVLLNERSFNGIRLVPRTALKFQSGYRFEPKQSDKWSLAVTTMSVFSKDYREVQVQAMYNRGWFLGGLGVQSFNSQGSEGLNLQASAGFKHDRFRVMGVYSSKLSQFDLSLMLYLPRKKPTSSPESSGR